MTISRRGFLGGILAVASAPAIVKASSLMPIYVPRHLRGSTRFIHTIDEMTWYNGSYVGNGKAEQFVYCGFKPDLILVKDCASKNWVTYEYDEKGIVVTPPQGKLDTSRFNKHIFDSVRGQHGNV